MSFQRSKVKLSKYRVHRWVELLYHDLVGNILCYLSWKYLNLAKISIERRETRRLTAALKKILNLDEMNEKRHDIHYYRKFTSKKKTLKIKDAITIILRDGNQPIICAIIISAFKAPSRNPFASIFIIYHFTFFTMLYTLSLCESLPSCWRFRFR